MNGLKTPRGMVFDLQNNLLVVESGGAGVRYIKLTDNGGTNVCVASSKQIIPERGVSGHHQKDSNLYCVDAYQC
jgi:hypothetical protein